MALHRRELVNDTAVNVAQLLKEPAGARRTVEVHLDDLPLDGDLSAIDVEAAVTLTRLETGILATGTVEGRAMLECVRCLELYEAPFSGEFDAEYRPTIDVRSGEPLPLPSDDEIFMVTGNHELDLTDLLRQSALLFLPIQPICRDDCPGIETAELDPTDEGDARFSVLGQLLDDDGAEPGDE